MRRNARSATRRLAAVLLAGVTACQPAVITPPLPQEQTIRLAPGPVGLTLAQSGAPAAPLLPVPPTSGEAAAKTAGEAALGSALVGATLGGSVLANPGTSSGGGDYAGMAVVALGLGMVAIGVVLAPIAALVGAGVGSAKAVPAEEREAGLAAMGHRLAAWQAGPDLMAALGSAAPGRTVVCPTVDACQTEDGQPAAAVLRLRPQPPTLAADDGIDPEITLSVQVDVDILEPATGRPLASRSWNATGRRMPFTELAGNDAANLAYELDWAMAAIAGQIARELLFPPLPEPAAGGTT